MERRGQHPAGICPRQISGIVFSGTDVHGADVRTRGGALVAKRSLFSVLFSLKPSFLFMLIIND